MIGILIAFSLNDWNENRFERKLENDYLQHNWADIQINKEQLKIADTLVGTKLYGLRIILDNIEEGTGSGDSIDWALHRSSSLGWTLSFESPANATYYEIEHEENYGRFIYTISLPSIIEKNKLIELLIIEEIN